MNRFEPKKPVYPLFSLLSFFLIFPLGMIFSSSSWMWVFYGVFWTMFFFFGYWKACLWSMIGLAVLSFFFVGITALFNRDPKAIEMAAFRCAMISVSAIPLLGSSYTRLGKSLDSLRCPRSFSLVIMVLFSFLPILLDERRKIMEAYKVRGGNPHLPFAFFKTMIVPFIVRTISISDTLSLSVETRGFDLRRKPKYIYDPVIPKWKDWLFLTFLLLFAGTMIALGIVMKTLWTQ